MTYTFIARACSDLPVATCCRVMKVSTSGFYAWRAQPCGDRDWADAALTNTIVDIHRMSRRSYGSPRVHAELRLGLDTRCSRKRVERLMRQAGVTGIHRRRGRGCTRRDPAAEPSDDLVNRAFDPDAPDRLWVMDVTEHPTAEGKVFLAVVLDAFSRRVVGWSIADHIRSELVVDAVQMAIWRRRPPEGQTVAHSDHGSQGEFRWSSQHLDPEVAHGTTTRLGSDGNRATPMRSPGRPPVWRREHRQGFWDAIAAGVSSENAAVAVGLSSAVGNRWFREGGGMRTVTRGPLSGRYLCFEEREEIALLRAHGHGVCEIARRLGRPPSTISRELRRNAATRGGRLDYRATSAQWHADRRARRPKVAKLAANDLLKEYVQDRLAGAIAAPDGTPAPGPTVRFIGRRHGRRQDRRWAKSWSPEQVSNRLRVDFPDDESMRISHEAIYQALFVQGRGALKRELVTCLRTGRALRVPRARSQQRRDGFVSPEVMISARPAEVEDRAVPGHWEGDLIIGLDKSAIGTLVERTTRFTMLLHLPRGDGYGTQPRVKNGPAMAGYGAEAVRDAIASTITTLPAELRRSLTWDRGKEMARHADLNIATGIAIYFCDPQSPWQRGTNENTNGLLRQYFPKGTDLTRHSTDELAAVAATLNERPRKTLGWRTPAEALDELLQSA